MINQCFICGKGKIVGHNVSYSKRRTRRVFLPNLHQARLATGQRVKVCPDCLRKLKKEGKLFKRVARIAKTTEETKVVPKKRGRPRKVKPEEPQI